MGRISGILGCDIHSLVLRSSTINQGFFVLFCFFWVLGFFPYQKQNSYKYSGNIYEISGIGIGYRVCYSQNPLYDTQSSGDTRESSRSSF